MFKLLAAVSALAMCVTAGAIAQTHAGANGAAAAGASVDAATSKQAALPPVDAMTCDQMQAEMAADGQTMRGQLDPQFGVEAQAQYSDAMQKEKQAQLQAVSPQNIIACMIPFMCPLSQQAQQQQQQAQNAGAEQQRNQARAQVQMNRLNASMNGLDQARLQALSNRFQAQHCQTPH
jgi:hypothetical protein